MGGRYRAVENMRRIVMKAWPVPLFANRHYAIKNM